MWSANKKDRKNFLRAENAFKMLLILVLISSLSCHFLPHQHWDSKECVSWQWVVIELSLAISLYLGICDSIQADRALQYVHHLLVSKQLTLKGAEAKQSVQHRAHKSIQSCSNPQPIYTPRDYAQSGIMYALHPPIRKFCVRLLI